MNSTEIEESFIVIAQLALTRCYRKGALKYQYFLNMQYLIEMSAFHKVCRESYHTRKRHYKKKKFLKEEKNMRHSFTNGIRTSEAYITKRLLTAKPTWLGLPIYMYFTLFLERKAWRSYWIDQPEPPFAFQTGGNVHLKAWLRPLVLNPYQSESGWR